MKKIAIIGSGTWGSALAIHLSKLGHNIKMWSFTNEELKDININRQCKFLNGVKFNENIAITLACKMSIKANMHISHEAQEELLNQLTQTDNPYNCPHGRPTIIKFSIYDLEKMFKRVMN